MNPTTWVIGLDRRNGEWPAAFARIPDGWPLGAPAWFRATDGARLGALPEWWQYTPGGLGCLLSHLRLLEDFLTGRIADDFDWLCVLEEDVVFADEWPARFEALWSRVPDDAQQIYLGGQHLAQPAPAGDGLVRCVDCNRTHAYMISRAGAAIAWHHIMSRLGQGRRGGQVDYLFGELHGSGRLVAYAPTVWLCGQAAGASTIHDGRVTAVDQWWSL